MCVCVGVCVCVHVCAHVYVRVGYTCLYRSCRWGVYRVCVCACVCLCRVCLCVYVGMGHTHTHPTHTSPTWPASANVYRVCVCVHMIVCRCKVNTLKRVECLGDIGVQEKLVICSKCSISKLISIYRFPWSHLDSLWTVTLRSYHAIHITYTWLHKGFGCHLHWYYYQRPNVECKHCSLSL